MRKPPLELVVAFLLSPILLLMSPPPAQGQNQGILGFQVDGFAPVGLGPYGHHIAPPWHDTEMSVFPGDTFSLTAEGSILRTSSSPAGDAAITSGPDGENVLCSFSSNQTRCLLLFPAYALIGKIGTAGEPFFVGSTYMGVAEEAGNLFLAFNDSYYMDNSGYFVVSGSIMREHVCEEPEAFSEASVGDVRSVQVNAPGMHTVRECGRRDRNGDSDSDSDSHGERCHRVRRFDEGGFHYSFSVRDHGMTEIESASLVITARDLDLIPDVHSRRNGTRWNMLSETMRVSTGGFALAFLDEGFALDRGITETDDVSVTYTVELDAAALQALAASGFEIDVDLEAAFENHRGPRFHENGRDEISVLVFFKGY